MTHSMVELKAVIEARRDGLATAPFIRGLERSVDVDDVRAFVPQLYFYVYAFQDILRLTAETITDPQLKAIAQNHRAEDGGHEQWFSFDVEALGCTRDVQWVFGPAHTPTRDMAYGLIGELLHEPDDRVRLVIPLVLEAMGSLFFVRMIELLDRAGFDRPLRYFARHHQQVEANHEIFADETSRALDAITFEPEVYARAVALVHRAFELAAGLADHLENHRSGRAGGRGV